MEDNKIKYIAIMAGAVTLAIGAGIAYTMLREEEKETTQEKIIHSLQNALNDLKDAVKQTNSKVSSLLPNK